MQCVDKGRKLSLDAAPLFQLRCDKKLGPTIVAFRPRDQRVSAYHMIGKQTAGTVMGNSGIGLAIVEPVGGNHAVGEFLTATEFGAS